MEFEGREQSRLELVALPTADGRRGLDRFSVALIKGASSFAELFDAFQQVGAGQVANGRSFVTLDDLNQCLYTSGHAANEHGFGDDLDYPDDDDAKAVDTYEAALCASPAGIMTICLRTSQMGTSRLTGIHFSSVR